MTIESIGDGVLLLQISWLALGRRPIDLIECERWVSIGARHQVSRVDMPTLLVMNIVDDGCGTFK